MPGKTSAAAMIAIAVTLCVGSSGVMAQTSFNDGAVSSSVSENAHKNLRDEREGALQGANFRGGYNVGRTSEQNVPGCVGPASFCNMYFGS